MKCKILSITRSNYYNLIDWLLCSEHRTYPFPHRILLLFTLTHEVLIANHIHSLCIGIKLSLCLISEKKLRPATLNIFLKVTQPVLEELGCGPRFNVFKKLISFSHITPQAFMNLGVSKAKSGKGVLYPAFPLLL